ncbi:MAG: radical SAM protein [Gammaproteobacteria bacterium]|nr:radical SAM protein [Gammaproteobacteria bacterium]
MGYTELLAKASRQNQLLTVLFELTYACNLACEFCYNDLSLTGRPLKLTDYQRLIDELAEMGALNITLSGGEPMIHPDFYAIGSYAKQKRFGVTVKTNGVPLTERNIKRLITEVDPAKIESSLHGACAQTHDRLTQVSGSFDRLVHNIGLAVKAGLKVTLNCPLTCYNESEVDAMYALADDLGVVLKMTAEISPRDDGDTEPLKLRASAEGITGMYESAFAYQRVQMQRAAKATDTITLEVLGGDKSANTKSEKGTHKMCGTGSSSATIDPYGNVYPCVQYRRCIGNVHDQSMETVWNGPNETLGEIRQLAIDAYDLAKEQKIRHFCMGTAALKTGNPLEIHNQEIETARILEEVSTRFPV